MSSAVRKAVFPVAGMGTRFLPATKASPKEMLPVVDKPLIQYAAEEAVSAGITDLVFVNGRNKRAIPDHFDKAYELEAELEARQKHGLLRIAREILPSNVHCIYVRQAQALGLGHAVLQARPVVGDEPFAVILADDLIVNGAGDSCMMQLVEQFSRQGHSVIGVEEVPEARISQYGVIDPGPGQGAVHPVRGIVEKPPASEAPSSLGVVGRYVLTPAIFDHLELVGKGSGGEIQLTDAISRLLQQESVEAYRFEGTRYDCGDKLGYLQANVELAMTHPEVGEDFMVYLRTLGKAL